MSELESYIEHVQNSEDRYQMGSLNSEENKIETKDYAPDSAEWFEWLASLKAFRFVGKHGNFTARQERIIGKDKKQRGTQYWFAYRKFQGQQFKRYLGLTEKLTLEHLEENARLIEEAIKGKLGIPAEKQLPKPEKFKPMTAGEKLLLQRIKKQEQTIEEQHIHIAESENRIRLQEQEIEQRDKAIEDLQTQMLEQAQEIKQLKKQVKMFEAAVKPTSKARKQEPIEAAAPEGFTWLADFARLHFVPYGEAERLYNMGMIQGQKITTGRGRAPIAIGPRGQRDFWVQLHIDASFRSCDDCPHSSKS